MESSQSEQLLRNCVEVKFNKHGEREEKGTQGQEIDFDLDYVVLINPDFCKDVELKEKAHLKIPEPTYNGVPSLLIKHPEILRYLIDVCGADKTKTVAKNSIDVKMIWKNHTFNKYVPVKSLQKIPTLEEHRMTKKLLRAGVLINILDPVSDLVKILQVKHRPLFEFWMKSNKIVPIDMLAWIASNKKDCSMSHTDVILDHNTLFTSQRDNRHELLIGAESMTKTVEQCLKVIKLSDRFSIIYSKGDEREPEIHYMTPANQDLSSPDRLTTLLKAMRVNSRLCARLISNYNGHRLDLLLRHLWHNLISIEFLPPHPSMTDYRELTHNDMIYLKFEANPYHKASAGMTTVTKMNVREVAFKRKFRCTQLEHGFFSLISVLLIKL